MLESTSSSTSPCTCRKLDDEMRHKAIDLAALYEHRMQEGSKAIFHLEGFVARFMSEYKTWSIMMLG